MVPPRPRSLLFFFNDTATTEIYTLSLHDALPISQSVRHQFHPTGAIPETILRPTPAPLDRKSTRLNSSHGYISYAVFCLKKKKRLCHPRSRTIPQAKLERPTRGPPTDCHVCARTR